MSTERITIASEEGQYDDSIWNTRKRTETLEVEKSVGRLI